MHVCPSRKKEKQCTAQLSKTLGSTPTICLMVDRGNYREEGSEETGHSFEKVTPQYWKLLQSVKRSTWNTCA